ncbi:hypothetical protein CDL62_15275 [Alkalitalea saponilacus]|nr:hypothetical protein CDL62_15275 [Alkalitalea saponilacus]
MILTITSCKTEIERMNWKHCGGNSIGDFIDFRSKKYKLINDSIFFVNEPVGVVLNVNKRLTDYQLIIQELNDTTLCYYCSK